MFHENARGNVREEFSGWECLGVCRGIFRRNYVWRQEMPGVMQCLAGLFREGEILRKGEFSPHKLS